MDGQWVREGGCMDGLWVREGGCMDGQWVRKGGCNQFNSEENYIIVALNFFKYVSES